MEPEKPLNTEDRESLGRLLRRRGRRLKAGANPNTDVKSWAEYGSVTLTPGPDRSQATRWVVIILALVFVFGLPIAFALMKPLDLIDPGTHSNALLIVWSTFLKTLIFLACFAIACLVGLGLLSPFMWLYAKMDSDTVKDRDRLIRRAERLHQERMAAGDGAGVAGIAAAEDAAYGHTG